MAKFNAKSFFVDHGEKVVFGVSAVMALYFAGLGGRWSSYQGTPQEITSSVQSGKQALEGHDWPQDERASYLLTPQNVPKQIVEENLRQPILAEHFPLSTRFVTSPWQGREPLRKPDLLALEDPIVDGGKVLIEILSDPSATEELNPEETEGAAGKDGALAVKDKGDGADDEFAIRGAGAAPDGSGLPGSGLPGSGLPGASLPGAVGAGTIVSDTGTYPGYTGEYPIGESGMEGEMGMTSANRAGQGYFYASVRAVFPLRAQITKYQEAMGAKTWQNAAQNFDLIDFNMERQEQVDAGADTWSEWALVDLQAANDVLDQTIGPEPDVVAGSVTNSVITMPLPTRVMGLWKKHASHPRIDDFELNDADIQQEVELNAKLLEVAREKKKEIDKLTKPKVEKGGFAKRMMDSRSLQASVFGGDPYGGMGMDSSGYGSGGMYNSGSMSSSSMMPGMGMSMPGVRPGVGGKRGAAPERQEDMMARILTTDDKDEQNKSLAEYIRKTITVSGELLLFRYIDFDVKPGKTYRYRVQLKLNNPNFGRNASEANGETSVVEAETFLTEWSQTTPAVTIERDVHYFVKDVDPQRGRTALTVYQWDTQKGTTVNADLDLYPGSYIAGKTKTRVIDAAKMTNEEKADYEFNSKDVFVDARPDVALLDRALHKDLKMPGGSRGEALLPEEVLVAQAATGELTILDPVRQSEEQKKLADRQTVQNKAYENVGQAAAGGMGYDPLMSDSSMYGEMMSGSDMYGSGGGKKSSRKKRANPLAAGGFPGGPPGEMPPGGGAGHAPPSAPGGASSGGARSSRGRNP
ncbi:MAG: hypothetical protein DWH91_18370 [Planctomycetota bacterium]|nr:MAG: hypothetical protein DWH91_18370 [Planctomycetota bacterium]